MHRRRVRGLSIHTDIPNTLARGAKHLTTRGRPPPGPPWGNSQTSTETGKHPHPNNANSLAASDNVHHQRQPRPSASPILNPRVSGTTRGAAVHTQHGAGGGPHPHPQHQRD